MVNACTVLTSAQCVAGKPATRLKIRVGSLYHASGGVQVQVTAVVVHPQYDAAMHQNDVAIVKLASDIPASVLSAISLGSTELQPGSELLIAGWGAASQGAPGRAHRGFGAAAVDQRELAVRGLVAA